MSDITKVALDAMGGDNAPVETVRGAVQAVQQRKDIQILLTGREEVIKSELAKYTYPTEQIRIVNATEVIETAEPPVKAIRGKKRFFDRSRAENGEERRSRCICFRREHGCSPGRRTGSGRQDQRCGETAAGPPSSYIERHVASDRLRRKCRRTAVTSCAVCEDGFHLYGKRGRQEKSHSRYCEYRRGGREGKCACKRDVPAS